MTRLDRFIRTTVNVLIILMLVSIILGTLWLTLSAYFAPSPWEVM